MLGVPLDVIDTVDDPVDGTVPAKKTVQTETVFRRLDLARVTFAYCAHGIGERDSTLHQIEPSEKLQLRRIEQPAVQPEQGHYFRSENSLVAEIVDGEQHLDAAERGIIGEMLADVDGRECRLPIVDVNDLRTEEVARHSDCGHRQNGEANVVVRVIRAAGSVDAFPIKQRRAVDKIKVDAALGGLINIHQVAGADGNPKTSISDTWLVWILVLTISGENHRRLLTTRLKRRWKRAQDIGETTCFCERRGLRCHHEDVHRSGRLRLASPWQISIS